MVNERSQKPANQISDKVDADDWFTYFRLHSLNPITPQRVGLRSWFDFNVSNIAEFAKLWSVGYISPVFKAGDIGDPNNYRGIQCM